MNLFADAFSKIRLTFEQLAVRKPVRRIRRSYSPMAEQLEVRQMLTAAILAPAVTSGTVDVQLVPLANVTAGVQEIVTFGVPFTKGSVTQAQLSQIRVLKNGVEIPAHVDQLTPWHSIDNASVDGNSVRVARIQIAYTFSTLNPETITVQWGGPARVLDRPTVQDPRIEWHTVTSGSFVAADNVQEPDVMPVLPKSYLALGMLDEQTTSTSNSVAETRDNPATMNSMSFTGFTEYDYAEKNFFYTIINQNPGITIDYKTQAEPWLYDRAAGMYELYFRSGFATALRQAIQNTDYYVDHLDSSGFFTLKPGDPKYAYNESLAYTYWLLGDNKMLAPISTVVNAYSSTITHWSPSLNFWTERNTGDKLLATDIAYEVTGNAAFKSSVQTIVNDLIWHQNGAGGQLPANRIDGGLYHTGEQHDISEASSADVLIASSWMSALVVDPMVRVYGLWQNAQIADFVVRMGNFEKAASKTDADGQFGGVTRYPDYLMRADGTTDNRSDTDVQHAMDVGMVAAWATYFSSLRGTPDASLRQLATDLYATYDVGVNYWTRPGGTNFNVSPPRRYTWEYKNSASFAWALNASDAPGQPGSLGFSVGSYSVNENQGTATITVNRTSGSSGSVSVNYATSNGTATAGSDYTASTGTLNFADGETSKTFTIPILNDTVVENSETILLTLSNPTGGASLGSQTTAVLTIQDDDVAQQPGTIQFSNPTYSVIENGGTATITVTRTAGSNVPVTVNYATSNGTATAGSDYTATSGTLTFAAGETTKTFTISIINDIIFEGNETVNLLLSNPTGGAVLGSQVAAVLTIQDDDVAPQPGTLQFSNPTYSVNENGGTATITVTRTAGSNVPVTVNYATSNGTATAGSDYTATSGTLSFAAGEISKTFTIPITNDVVFEGNETINLLLSNPTGGASLGSQTAAVLTIQDDDVAPQPGTLQFSNPTYSVNENGGTATITVTRTAGSNVPVTVNYATSNGTAIAGSDYTATSGTLNFAAGETTKTFTIPIINDTDIENPETIILTLSSPTGGANLGSQSTATLTIVSEDSNGQATTVTLQQGVNGYSGEQDATISTQYTQYTQGNGNTEFDDSQLSVYQTTGAGSYITKSLIRFSDLGLPSTAAISGATLTLSVESWYSNPTIRGYYMLSSWSDTPGSSSSQLGWLHRGTGQNWASPGATGQGTDVVAGNSFLLSGIRAAGVQTITVHLDPAVVQSWINNPSSNQGIMLVSESPGKIVHINSSDNPAASLRPKLDVTYTVPSTTSQPGTLQFSNPTYAVNESGGTATITVTRTAGTNVPVTVNYATSNGTATSGSDYSAVSGTLSFAAGETSKTFTIPITDDTVFEGDETINLTLSNPTGGAALGSQTTAVLTIQDNDVAPQSGSLQFSNPTYTVTENGGTATVTVTRTAGTNVPVTVAYATNNGTATAGSDYTAVNGILSFAAGETSKTFTIPIIDDTAFEGDETINLTLSNPTGGATLGPQVTAVLTIQENDAAPVPGSLQFSNPTYTVTENGGTATITVTRTAGSNVPVTVDYATNNGTATAGSDYTAVSGTLSFAAGETSKTFTIPITDDTVFEGNETINLILSNPTGGAALGSQTTAVLTILEDDVPGTVQFSNTTYAVNENGGVATITVIRTSGTDVAVTVDYATTDGTATAGSDYTARSGTLNFAAGETSKTFTIPILDDNVVENAETILLTLSNPTGGANIGGQSTATLTINSDDVAGLPTTVTVQQGVNGYAGASDASISTQYAQFTGGNGTTYLDSSQLSVFQVTGSDGYTLESLIRFSDLGIPSTAAVTGATLTLSVDSWFDSPIIRGYYVKAPWDNTPGSSASQLGWLHRGTGEDWASPGATGQGTDVVAGKSFVLSGIRAAGVQAITIQLDPDVVQSWINDPSSNQGFLLVNESPGMAVRINSSENSIVALRPQLDITYTVTTTMPQSAAVGTTLPQVAAARFANPTNLGSNDVTKSATADDLKSFITPNTLDSGVQEDWTFDLDFVDRNAGTALEDQIAAALTSSATTKQDKWTFSNLATRPGH